MALRLSMSSASFNQCRTQRDVSKFTHIKEEVRNIPWSSCLPIIKHLQSTPEITQAFEYLPKIENVFKRKNESRQVRFKLSSKNLLKHLMAIAVQEQRNILQELVWKDWKVQAQATLQSYTKLSDSTLVLSSDYGVDTVKPDKMETIKVVMQELLINSLNLSILSLCHILEFKTMIAVWNGLKSSRKISSFNVE